MIRGMLDNMADEMIAAKTYAMPEANIADATGIIVPERHAA